MSKMFLRGGNLHSIFSQSANSSWRRAWILRFYVYFLIVESVSGICVWQGGGGFRLACGFKQSGLLRMRSLGGLKGWAGAGFTIGDEDGFKDSLTNTESKSRGIGTYQQRQRHPSLPVQQEQYRQYNNVALNQGQHYQHESENLQKRASLWNSWKWPSIIKKKSPNRNAPQRMGPVYGIVPQAYPPRASMPMYLPQPRGPAVYPHPGLSPYPLASQHYPNFQVYPRPMSGFPVQQDPRLKELQRRPHSNEVGGFTPMPEIDPFLKDASEEVESQIETVLKALKNKAAKQRRKESKSKKPYGLQLLQNSANYGTKFQVSENSVPAVPEAEIPSDMTGYDTNLFPDIYFTSTTPRDKLKKILEIYPDEEQMNNVDQESTTEAILRKLRLKKIKLLKKGHKLKIPKPSKVPKDEEDDITQTSPPTTTTTKMPTTTQKEVTSPKIISTTKMTTETTTKTTRPSTTTQRVTTSTTTRRTTTEKPQPPMSMRTRPTERPDYADSFYREVEQRPSNLRENWREFRPHSSPRPYIPIAENPLVLSGKWKDIYDPRYSPEHEVNRGKLELLAAALTTTSQRPQSREYDEDTEYLSKPPKYFRDDYPKAPEYPYHTESPKRYESRNLEEGLPSQVRVVGRDGQFVKFDSRESLNLVSRTKSYNDAFYSHFNKSAVEMADNQPHPTPFHYFSAFYNQNSTPKTAHPPPPEQWTWDRKPSAAHFARNDYSPSPTEIPRPMPRPIDHWAGLGQTRDSSSHEEFRPRLDHSVETGDLLRQKVMSFLTANRDLGRGVWDSTAEQRHPNFVTNDNFQPPHYQYLSDENRRLETSPRPPAPNATEFYYSSTPSFSEWKNYVGAVSGISSTSTVPPPTQARLIEPPVSRQHGADENPQFVRGENKNETQKSLSPIKPELKENRKSKPEVKKTKTKLKTKDVSTIVKTTTATSTTKEVEVTTPIPTVTSTRVTEPINEHDDEESDEYSEEDDGTLQEANSESKSEVKPKHPKKPAAAAFLPVSGPSESPRKVIAVTPYPPLRLQPPPAPQPTQLKTFESFPNQNLGPPPPPPDFATIHLNEFAHGNAQHINIQTDWNLHPLPTESPPNQIFSENRNEIKSQGHLTTPLPPPTIHPQFQQRQSLMPPQTYQRLPAWNHQGIHVNPPHNAPPFRGPIPYPQPRPFSQQYPSPANQGMGSPPKPIRHMIPGPFPPGHGPHNNFPIHRGPPPPPPNMIHGHPPPMRMEEHPQLFSSVPRPNHPQIRPVEMTHLSPPPAPPPQIIPSRKATTTTTSTTTSTTPRPEAIKIKPEKPEVNERDMIMNALQTLTRAKTQVLHSVVNEKYGGDFADIVKPPVVNPARTTTSTSTVRPTPTTKLTTTTPMPTTTMATRIVFDEIPSKFAPLVNYVKNLKVPTYENDKVQIDYFNFKSEEQQKGQIPETKKSPEMLGLNIDDLALLASTNHQVQVTAPNDASKFEEMLRHALASKTTPVPTPSNPSPTSTPLVDTLTKMGIIQKLQDRNISSNQIETLKKLIQLNKFQARVDHQPTTAPITPPPTIQLIDNFRHILSHIPPASGSPNILGRRISHIDPSLPIQQHLLLPPSTTAKPSNSLYSTFNGPTLQALKAIALNRIQNVQPAPQINLPQQTAPEEEESLDQITVDLSPLLGLSEHNNNPNVGIKLVKVRNAPKSYYPGDRILPFEGGKEIATSFQCERQEFFPGLYGDQSNSCKVFHLCAKTEAGFLTKTFRCPQGTLFDQEVLRCNWSLYVNCKGVEAKYLFNKYLSQSFQFLKSLGEFSASIQPNNSSLPVFG